MTSDARGDLVRIGMLTQWFAPEPGGGVVPSVLAQGLARRGHDLRVLTGFPNYPTGRTYDGYRQRLRHKESPLPGVTVHRLPLIPSHDDSAVGRIANYGSFAATGLALGARPLADRDALWVYNSPATVGAIANRVRRRHCVPFLLHVMDVWPDSVLESGMLGEGGLARFADRCLTSIVRRAYDGAAAIAVTSPGQVELLHSRGVPASRLHYAPVWADEEVFFPQPTDRSLLGPDLADVGTVVMYAGAIGHVQGLATAVRAVAAVADAGVHLVLVGSGVADESLRQLRRDLGACNVHFLGRRPAAEMGALSSAADLHLVSLADTPLLRVTMPSKLQSILALGRPVIATAAGDAAAVVRAADAGLVSAPGDVDALVAHLREIARAGAPTWTQWGRQGRAYYEREFAQERAIGRVESLLADIAGSSAR